jgi:hypothetical protein
MPELDPDVAGSPMPLQFEFLDQDQIAVLEDWVRDGAQPGTFFDQNVRPIFGSEEDAALGTFGTGRCIQCHYAGTPNPPNLSEPFGPEGLVGVRASARADLMRVVPGDVENSFMILKVRAREPDVLLGAPMPYKFEPLSSRQIQTVRDWIADGALP